MRFAKGQGTGNDFVILVDPGDDQGLSADLAARLCDRRVGMGADGVLRAVRTDALAAAPNGSAAGSPAGPVPEWYMDYRNSDGSPAEMCGNGIRVFARYLADQGLATRPAFTVATRSGVRRARPEAGGHITAATGAAAVRGPGRGVVAGPGGV